MGAKRESAPRAYRSPLRQEQARATRERILDGAALHLASDPDEISFPAIAHLAGVSLPTVHRQFPDRRAVFEALFERSERQVEPMPRPGSVAELVAALPQFVGRWASQSPLEAALRRSRVGQKARQDFGHPQKREWLAGLFREQLAALSADEARATEDALMFLTAAGSVEVLTRSVGLTATRATAVLRLLLDALDGHHERGARAPVRAAATPKKPKTPKTQPSKGRTR